MRIGIDARLWNETGVGRYTRNLIINLIQLDKENEYVLFARSTDKALISKVTKEASTWQIVSTDINWHSLSEQVSFPRVLNNFNLDLVHFPYFSVPIFYNKPFVVTIHDLIVNKFNTGRASTLPLGLYLTKRVGYHAVLSNAIFRSKKIIVPSEAVRKDLIKTYKSINPSKVVAIYEGGFEINDKLTKMNEKPTVEGRYILRIGNFYPHKNVEGLLLAFKNFLYDSYENHDIKLVLVGKRDYFFNKIKSQIEKLNIGENTIFLEEVSDYELVNLYKNAVATIIPSFLEGFSLTALEAMSCGSVVIASDIPVHREILRDYAIYCNPKDIHDINQKIAFACSLIERSRKEMIDQGKKRSKQFSWNKMAKQTLELYRGVFG